jgi:hypothetical protein
MRVPDELAGEAAPDPGSSQDLGGVIRRLVEGQLYCVLCTQGQGQPYGSLVAYSMTPDLCSAVFVTQKATRKYRLLSDSAHVALVVDNRSTSAGQLMTIEGLTATGLAREVPRGPELEPWYRLLTDRHPYLGTFARSASCGLFRVDIARYFHVTRFQEVRQWVPTRPA